MYPMPGKALALLGRDHGVDVRAYASVNGSEFILPVQIISGSITVDAKSPARRTLSCEVLADYDDPAVDPLAAELRVEYGIVDATTGEVYWTPVGTFVITDAKEGEPGLMSVSGTDRWLRVQEARFETSVSTAGDTLAAIRSLVQDADNRITVDTSGAPTGYTHRRMVWDRDRDKAVIQLAASIGCIVWFDPLGVARVAPVAALGSTPVWVVSGGEGGVKVKASRGISRKETYNAVSVTGEPGGDQLAVVRVARDTDPLSRTRWGGPFKKKTRFYSSNLITTGAQAQAVAESMLARARGVARTVVVETIQHPGLDGNDVVQAQMGGAYQALRTGSFQLSLGLSTMTITALSDTPELEGE